MTLDEFMTLDRRSRKQVLYEMHKERLRRKETHTPEEMAPFIAKLYAWEKAHAEAKSD